MMKKILLGLMLLHSVHGKSAPFNLEFGSAMKGLTVCALGAWTFTRLKRTYDDWKLGENKPITFGEDFHNVLASIGCVAGFACVAGANKPAITALLGSGAVLGGTYLSLKAICSDVKNMRLRTFVGGVAAAALVREVFIRNGIPVLKFGKK